MCILLTSLQFLAVGWFADTFAQNSSAISDN